MIESDKLKKYLDELINYAENGDRSKANKIKTKILEEYLSNDSGTETSLFWGTEETKKEKLSGPFHIAYRKMLPGDPLDKEGYGKKFENIEEFRKWVHSFNTPVEDWDKPNRELWEDEKIKFLSSFTIAQPVYDNYMIDIEMIETNEGIIFSSGRYTSGDKYIGDKGWEVIEELIKKPGYKFV